MAFMFRRLELGPQKFEKNVPDQGGDHGDCQIGEREDIPDRPCHAALGSPTGALKFSHQQVGIKEEDDEPDFDQSPPPDVFHRGKDNSAICKPVAVCGCTIPNALGSIVLTRELGIRFAVRFSPIQWPDARLERVSAELRGHLPVECRAAQVMRKQAADDVRPGVALRKISCEKAISYMN
jgi:hypothetical protein